MRKKSNKENYTIFITASTKAVIWLIISIIINAIVSIAPAIMDGYTYALAYSGIDLKGDLYWASIFSIMNLYKESWAIFAMTYIVLITTTSGAGMLWYVLWFGFIKHSIVWRKEPSLGDNSDIYASDKFMINLFPMILILILQATINSLTLSNAGGTAGIDNSWWILLLFSISYGLQVATPIISWIALRNSFTITESKRKE